MHLPKSWTTVTTLSKTLAMILFVALPFIGFSVAVSYQQKLSLLHQPQTVTPTRSEESNNPRAKESFFIYDGDRYCIATNNKITVKTPLNWECNIEEVTDKYGGTYEIELKSDQLTINLNNYGTDIFSYCEVPVPTAPGFEGYQCDKTTLHSTKKFFLSMYDESSSYSKNRGIMGKYYSKSLYSGVKCPVSTCPIISVVSNSGERSSLRAGQLQEVISILTSVEIEK